MTELTTALKTRCVGRYLIDMPDNVLTIGQTIVEGVRFEATPMTLNAFRSELALLEATLKIKKSTLGYQFLFDHGEVRGISESRYFISLGSDAEASDANRIIEAYKWDRGYRIQLRIEGTDFLNSADKDEPWVKKMSIQNDVPQKTRLVFDLLEKVRGRPDDNVPDEPGVCFDGGFLVRKAASAEEVQSSFALKDRPDVSFSLETYSDLRDPETDTLPNRIPAIQSTIGQSSSRIIRSGTRNTGGMNANEILVSGFTQPDVPGQIFSLEANTTRSTPSAPYLVLDMRNGAESFLVKGYDIKAASLTEGEAVALWDVISRTLRPRPNGV